MIPDMEELVKLVALNDGIKVEPLSVNPIALLLFVH